MSGVRVVFSLIALIVSYHRQQAATAQAMATNRAVANDRAAPVSRAA